MKIILTCLLAIGVSCALSAQKATIIELNGNWNFSRGDNMKWAKPSFNDSKWENAIIPTWDWIPGYDGYGWYRKDFLLSEKETYFFNLGQVDDDCQVYFNGELLSLYVSPKPKNDNADTSRYNQWKKYRCYYIPKKLVKPGKKNTLAIRVWDTGDQGGIRYGSIFISNTVFYNQLPLQLAGDWFKKDGSNEWYVGFYNNNVVYKGGIWEYESITTKDGGYNITLSGKGQKEYLYVRDDNGSGNYLLGPDEQHTQLCSLEKTYTTAIDTTRSKQAYYHANKGSGLAHYKGWIKNYTSALGHEVYIQINTPYTITGKYAGEMKEYTQRDITTEVQPDGSFSVDIDDVPGPIIAYLRGLRIAATPVYLEPDKTVFQVIDPEEFKIYVTPEWYARQRRTLYMGDLAIENQLQLYTDWINTAPNAGRDVWDRLQYIASQYAAGSHVSDMEMNDVVSCIAGHYKQYNDTASLRTAKLWAAKVLQSSPDNHQFNNTFNIVLQNLGEHLEGLEYLVKALQIAEKDNKPEYVKAYKESIKEYIAEMLK
ncbi:MAG: hypothetical protein J0H74_15815 [Chitinophagaceae bacterium]|nr:hypothetical protein [Chitinophagaceae bacterium]